MIVIDCSYTMALVMPDEQQPASLTRTLESRLVAPGLWPLEVANALRNVVRRGRLRSADVSDVCARLDVYAVEVLGGADVPVVQRFASTERLDLSAYDAAYIDLAVQGRYALATLDSRMAAAAQRAGVTVLN